tara:strand:- start:2235 stop:3101 length:867 start_codon:yes stop_codon:yes gene_type:complete
LLVIEIPWDPNIFTIFGLLITWHGFFTSVGLLLGVWLGVRVATALNCDPDEAYNLALIGIPGGIIGARTLYVIENIERMDSAWDWFAITEGGISIWGAVLGGVALPTLFALIKGINLRPILDAAGFGLILGMGIGRVGDLINGEHCSRMTDWLIGVTYTHPQSPGLRCAVLHHGSVDSPVHPATTYEMLGDLGILALLFFAVWKLGLWKWPGLTFLLYLDSYAIMRFALTYLRVDSSETFLLDIRVPQLVSLLVLVGSVPLAILFLRKSSSAIMPPQPLFASWPRSKL